MDWVVQDVGWHQPIDRSVGVVARSLGVISRWYRTILCTVSLAAALVDARGHQLSGSYI